MEKIIDLKILISFLDIIVDAIKLVVPSIIVVLAFIVIIIVMYYLAKLVVFLMRKCNEISVVKIVNKIMSFVSGEWIFNYMPNGGTAVAIRTIWVGSLVCVFLGSIYLKVYGVVPLNKMLQGNMYEILGIYAAVYAALYARFVSQWTYLSNLYNSIREQEINNVNVPSSVHIINERKAEFIFDAKNLHLIRKKKFASIIYLWLTSNEEVMKRYIDYDPECRGDIRKARDNFIQIVQSVFRGYREKN